MRFFMMVNIKFFVNAFAFFFTQIGMADFLKKMNAFSVVCHSQQGGGGLVAIRSMGGGAVGCP